jgi:hypothetical protein
LEPGIVYCMYSGPAGQRASGAETGLTTPLIVRKHQCRRGHGQEFLQAGEEGRRGQGGARDGEVGLYLWTEYLTELIESQPVRGARVLSPRLPPHLTSSESRVVCDDWTTPLGAGRSLAACAECFPTIIGQRAGDPMGTDSSTESCVWLLRIQISTVLYNIQWDT